MILEDGPPKGLKLKLKLKLDNFGGPSSKVTNSFYQQKFKKIAWNLYEKKRYSTRYLIWSLFWRTVLQSHFYTSSDFFKIQSIWLYTIVGTFYFYRFWFWIIMFLIFTDFLFWRTVLQSHFFKIQATCLIVEVFWFLQIFILEDRPPKSFFTKF